MKKLVYVGQGYSRDNSASLPCQCVDGISLVGDTCPTCGEYYSYCSACEKEYVTDEDNNCAEHACPMP